MPSKPTAPPEGKRKNRKRDSPRYARGRFQIDSRWFKEKLAQKGISVRAAGPMIGMDQSLLSRRLNGTIAITLDECRDIADLLGQPFEEVAKRAGIDRGAATGRRARVVGVADQTGVVQPLGPGLPEHMDLPGLEIVTMEGVLVLAPGTALDRGTCFYTPSRALDPAAVGRLALVGVAGKNRALLLGVLKQSFNRGGWDVEGLSGETVAQGVDAEWASPVAWVRL